MIVKLLTVKFNGATIIISITGGEMNCSSHHPVGLMESLLDKINNLTEEVRFLKNEVCSLKEKVIINQAWFDLRQLCSIKGLKYNTVVSKHSLQPNKGKPDATIAGKRMWRRETALHWCQLTDEDI